MNDFLVYLLLNVKGAGAVVAMMSFAFVVLVVSIWLQSDVKWKDSSARDLVNPALIVLAISVTVHVLIPPEEILIKMIGG